MANPNSGRDVAFLEDILIPQQRYLKADTAVSTQMRSMPVRLKVLGVLSETLGRDIMFNNTINLDDPKDQSNPMIISHLRFHMIKAREVSTARQEEEKELEDWHTGLKDKLCALRKEVNGFLKCTRDDSTSGDISKKHLQAMERLTTIADRLTRLRESIPTFQDFTRPTLKRKCDEMKIKENEEEDEKGEESAHNVARLAWLERLAMHFKHMHEEEIRSIEDQHTNFNAFTHLVGPTVGGLILFILACMKVYDLIRQLHDLYPALFDFSTTTVIIREFLDRLW